MLETDRFLQVEMAMKMTLGSKAGPGTVAIEVEESTHYRRLVGSDSRFCHVRGPLGLCLDYIFPDPGIGLYSD